MCVRVDSSLAETGRARNHGPLWVFHSFRAMSLESRGTLYKTILFDHEHLLPLLNNVTLNDSRSFDVQILQEGAGLPGMGGKFLGSVTFNAADFITADADHDVTQKITSVDFTGRGAVVGASAATGGKMYTLKLASCSEKAVSFGRQVDGSVVSHDDEGSIASHDSRAEAAAALSYKHSKGSLKL